MTALPFTPFGQGPDFLSTIEQAAGTNSAQDFVGSLRDPLRDPDYYVAPDYGNPIGYGAFAGDYIMATPLPQPHPQAIQTGPSKKQLQQKSRTPEPQRPASSPDPRDKQRSFNILIHRGGPPFSFQSRPKFNDELGKIAKDVLGGVDAVRITCVTYRADQSVNEDLLNPTQWLAEIVEQYGEGNVRLAIMGPQH